MRARSASAPERLQLVGLHRARDRPRLRSRIRRARPLRHVREQRGDARQGAQRQFRLGRRVSDAQPPRADARLRTAGAAAITSGFPASPISTRGSARPPGIPALAMGRALHVERHRHRLQPQPARSADALGRSVESRAEGPPDDARRSRGHARRVPEEARPVLQRHRARRTRAAPNAKRSRRSRCCARI